MCQTRHFKIEEIIKYSIRKYQISSADKNVESYEGHQRWQEVKAESSETFANNIHDDD